MGKGKLITSDDLLICTACGTQFSVPESIGKSSCRICDDPRQYVPAAGQRFTTLAKLRQEGHKVEFRQDEYDERFWSIFISPEKKVGIGERAILIQTPHGNLLWDLFAFLDEATVEKINSLGGIDAIVISHPHFYTTYADWSRTFSCPVYSAKADSAWLERTDTPGLELRLLDETYQEILPGATAITCGGHFDGSLVLHYDNRLLVADTLMTVPAALNPSPPPPPRTSPFSSNPSIPTITYSFLYSIPNYIPLNPDAIHKIWLAIKPAKYDWSVTMGGFWGMDVRSGVRGVSWGGEAADNGGRGGESIKWRALESMKAVVRGMGYQGHAIESETLDM